MDSVEVRLIRCFTVVFPDLDRQQIPEATVTSVDSWDSVATVTLINLLEEEFGINIDMDFVDQIASFRQCLDYVRTKTVAAV